MATIAGGVSMKRRDLIRQKNKLAKTGGFRYIRYAKYACVAMVVLFLVYVGGLSNLSGKSYEELISKSPIVITGFMICTANLYVWYVLKHFLKDLAVPQHVESIRVNLLLMTSAVIVSTCTDTLHLSRIWYLFLYSLAVQRFLVMWEPLFFNF